MNIDWDAREYSRAFSFVPQYGEEVLKTSGYRHGKYSC